MEPKLKERCPNQRDHTPLRRQPSFNLGCSSQPEQIASSSASHNTSALDDNTTITTSRNDGLSDLVPSATSTHTTQNQKRDLTAKGNSPPPSSSLSDVDIANWDEMLLDDDSLPLHSGGNIPRSRTSVSALANIPRLQPLSQNMEPATLTKISDPGQPSTGIQDLFALLERQMEVQQQQLDITRAQLKAMQSILTTTPSTDTNAVDTYQSKHFTANTPMESEDLNVRFENLRRVLMLAGIWYENVDEVLGYCDADTVSNQHGNNTSFTPVDACPLRFYKATCLDPELGLGEQFRTIGLERHFAVTSERHYGDLSLVQVKSQPVTNHQVLSPSNGQGNRQPEDTIVVTSRQPTTSDHANLPTNTFLPSTEQLSNQAVSDHAEQPIAKVWPSDTNGDVVSGKDAFRSDTRPSEACTTDFNVDGDVLNSTTPRNVGATGEDPMTFPNTAPTNQSHVQTSTTGHASTPTPQVSTNSAAAKAEKVESVHPQPAKGDPWTVEENELMMATYQSLEQMGHSKTLCLKLTIDELISQGSTRTEGSYRTRWSSVVKGIYMKKFGAMNTASPVATTPLVPSARLANIGQQPNVQKKAAPNNTPFTAARSALTRPIPSPWLDNITGVISGPVAIHDQLSSPLEPDDYLNQRLSGRPINHYKRSICQEMNFRKTWTGASGDIISLCWSPDGTRFLAGAAAITDDRNLHYNRPNNLLYGDMVNECLTELPDHRIARSEAASRMSDPWSYTTVSHVHWSENDLAYTGSFDKTVKVWNINDAAKPQCLTTLRHPLPVEVVAVASGKDTLLVTGTAGGYGSLRCFSGESYNNVSILNLKKKQHLTGQMNPTCLRFGLAPSCHSRMVAGFGSTLETSDGASSLDGWLGMWSLGDGRPILSSLTPDDTYVFDVAWSPTTPNFIAATACRALQGAIDGAKTTVKLFSADQQQVTLQCYLPALDINEVSICPYNEMYILASCTDRRTYVWDCRHADRPVHVLQHDMPVGTFDTNANLELVDTGVNVLQWGTHGRQLYTGASDGVLKEWNIHMAPEDALTVDVVSIGAELMSGKVSPDKSQLLLGDATGSIHLFTMNTDADQDIPDDFEYHRAECEHHVNGEDTENSQTKGRDAARELIESGQIEVHPTFGPGKGPNYRGPFAAWARPAGPTTHLNTVALLPEIAGQQRDRTRYGAKRERSTASLSRARQAVGFDPDKKIRLRLASSRGREDNIRSNRQVPARDQAVHKYNRIRPRQTPAMRFPAPMARYLEKSAVRTYWDSSDGDESTDSESADGASTEDDILWDDSTEDGSSKFDLTEESTEADLRAGHPRAGVSTRDESLEDGLSDDESTETESTDGWFPSNWMVDANLQHATRGEGSVM